MNAKRRLVLAMVGAVVSSILLSGVAQANESTHSSMECGGLGLNPGQAWHVEFLVGGPAVGPNRQQSPPEFAVLLGATSVGALLQRDCDQINYHRP